MFCYVYVCIERITNITTLKIYVDVCKLNNEKNVDLPTLETESQEYFLEIFWKTFLSNMKKRHIINIRLFL